MPQMPEYELSDLTAGQRTLMLENMLHSPAFALFTDRWNALVFASVESAIFDPSTTDFDTRVLKQVRQALTGTHHPRKIVETLIRTATAESLKPKN